MKNHEIRGVDIEKAHFNVLPVITIPHVDNPTAIDYDIEFDTLYWADKGLNVIKKASFNAEVETLIDKGMFNYQVYNIASHCEISLPRKKRQFDFKLIC